MKTSSIFLFFIPFVLLMGSAPPLVELESDSAVVVQLFTSQGCSSCPSADELLEQIKNEYDSNVIVLSYHVDYWNRLGWKDPFSKNIQTYSIVTAKNLTKPMFIRHKRSLTVIHILWALTNQRCILILMTI